MAAFENVKDMYDISLKPRMLHTLLKEDVPDDKKPLCNPSKLSRIVSTIRSFKLLSESFPASMDAKLMERWKTAVNDWFDRLLSLVANTTMPDKCWAGVCLLGVSCQECSSERFLASYAVLFDKLLLHIQSPVDSQFVKVASCSSLADLVTRLAGFPNAKKDGTSLAGKLIQPILKLLQEHSQETVWEGAINLLCTVITYFPASVHRHYDSVEAVIASKIFSGKCSLNVLKKLGYCLAFLPKSRGDEDSWIAMLRKILLLVNGYLTEIFHGLEEDTKWDEAVRLLVPLGEDTPTSLWGQNLLEETSDKTTKRSKLSSVSILILSCSTMLTTSYPVQVTVPVRSLLALIERVLMVNGSVPHAKSPFVIAAEQDFICSELPVLHSYSLELLTAVIKGMRSQLLPHAAYVVRLVKEYFRRCQLSELRIKIYSITKILLISMGVGVAIYLAQEVVNNALLDLVPGGDDSFSSASTMPSSESLPGTCNRKRKLGASGFLEQNNDQINLEVEGPKPSSVPLISVKIASLEALKALLTVGGALKSESWRSKVDNLLITIAADSFKGRWANAQRNAFFPNEPFSRYADLQLAAFSALLASLLSPSHVHPPHLAQSLELFRRGRQETGTKLSDFCSYALLALEVLTHPRALPLVNSPSPHTSSNNHGFPEILYAGGQKQKAPFSIGMQEIGCGSPDSDDDLYDSWLGASKEADTALNCPDNNINREELSKNLEVAASSLATKFPKQCEEVPAVASGDREMGGTGKEIIVESQLQGLASSKGTAFPATPDDPQDLKIEAKKVTLETDALVSNDSEMVPVEIASATLSSAAKSKTIVFESDEDSSSDSLPDIVDADLDSD